MDSWVLPPYFTRTGKALKTKLFSANCLPEMFNQCLDVMHDQMPAAPYTEGPAHIELILPPECPRGNGYLLAQLYLLANNYHEAPIDQPNQDPAEVMATQDNRIVNLLDRVCRINADHLTSLLSSPDPITEAIRDSAFASALRLHRLDRLRHIASIGVDLDARIRAQSQSMKTPLQFAAEVQIEEVSFEMIQILLDLGARPSLPLHPETLSPLYLCIEKKHYRAASLLLERSAGVGPRHLMLAIEQSIDYDANPNLYPLLHDPSKLVALLQRSGAGINERLMSTSSTLVDVTPLGFAVMGGNGALAERLLDLGADLNAHQTTECIRLLPGLGMPDHVGCHRSVTTTCLGLAVARGETEVVDLLLSKGASRLDTLPVEGYRSPLLIACVHKHSRIAITLIKKGVNVPISNENAKEMECVPVSLTLDAALRFDLNPPKPMSSDFRLLRKLLSHYAINTSTGGGLPVSHRGPRTTLLKQAIEAGIAQNVRQYIEAGTNMPLVVRQIGNYEVALVLERYGVLSKLLERNCSGVLLAAIRATQYEVVSTVLRSGIALHDEKGKFLDAAVSTGDVRLISELLDHKAIFTSKTFPLAVRCQYPVQVLHLLLAQMPHNWTKSSDKRESVIGKEKSIDSELAKTGAADAMIIALEIQRIDLLELILGGVAVLSRQLGKVLATAVILEQFELVKPLLDNGAAPDGDPFIDPLNGKILTAWDASLRSRQIRVVEAMIQAGADPSARSPQTQRTPVQVAVEAMQPELLACLIRHEADLNAPATSSVPTTALQYAAIHGYKKLVEMLLDAGADVNAEAEGALHGVTALEGAAERGRMEVVYLLIENGARDQGTEGRQFQKAISLAEDQGHNALARWLRGLVFES